MRQKICVTVSSIAMAIAGQIYGNTPDEPNCSDNVKTCCNPSRYRSSCCDVTQPQVFIFGDFLYWKGELSGFEGAFSNSSISTSANTTTLSEYDLKPDFEWKPGFRVGAEFLMKCLEVNLDWTHFHGGAHYHKNLQYSSWKLKYDTLDLTLGYQFYACSRFLIKPFLGIRGAKIHRTLKSHLETITLGSSDTPILVMSDLDDRDKFLGLGPQIGVEGDWYLGKNLSLYGSFDFVTYYGNIDNDNDETDSFTGSFIIKNWNKRRCFNCLATDGAIGIRWDKYAYCGNQTVHFLLKLGAEQHRIYDVSDLGTEGTLSIDGGVAEAGLGILF